MSLTSIDEKDNEESWTTKALNKIEPILQKIYNHGFIQELISGDLKKEVFDYYIAQDVIYCKNYQKCMEIIANRSECDKKKKDFFNNSAESTKKLINYLIKEYLNCQNPKEEAISKKCKEYCELELKTCQNDSLGEAMAVVLPCYLVYECVGKYIEEKIKDKDFGNNPYKKFIKDAFIQEKKKNQKNQEMKSTDKFKILINDFAKMHQDLYEKMINKFVKATEMEHDFWDFAYKLDK